MVAQPPAPEVDALIARLVAAAHDERLSTGGLYLEAAAMLAAQAQRIEELTVQLNAMDQRVARISGEASRQIDVAVTRAEAAEAALRQAEDDARRYRWLRANRGGDRSNAMP